MVSNIDSSNQANVLNSSSTLPSQVASLTYSCSSNYKSDTSYWLDNIVQSNITWNSTLSISARFSCSMSGSSTINVQFSTDGSGNPVPSWGTIDLVNNLLNFSVPYVSSDTTYSFILVVKSSEAPSYTYYVNLKINVQSCKVSNWMTCVTSDDSKWATCNSGYILNNYTWTIQTSTLGANITTNTTTNTTTNPTSNTASNITTTTQQISSTARTAATISIASAWVGVVAVAGVSMLTFSSPQGVWSVVDLFQTLTTLLLTRAYLPEEVTKSFSSINQYTNFSFDFIPYTSISFLSIIMNWFNLPVSWDLMAKVGLKSGSTFFNNISLLINILFVVFMHQMFLILRSIMCTKWKDRPWVKIVINKVYKFLTLCLYIRLMMEAYQFLLIWSTDEIYSFKTSKISEITSLVIAILAFIVWNIFTILLFVLTIKQIYKSTAETPEKSQSYFDEIFDGIKDTKYSKWFSLMFIMRKALIIMFLLFLPNLNIIINVGFFVLIPESLLPVFHFSPATSKSKRQYCWNYKRDVDTNVSQHVVQIQ